MLSNLTIDVVCDVVVHAVQYPPWRYHTCFDSNLHIARGRRIDAVVVVVAVAADFLLPYRADVGGSTEDPCYILLLLRHVE